MESVSPSLGVMANDVFADSCPFFRIFRRERMIWLNVGLILNRNPQAVIRFNVCVCQRFQQIVGKGKIVILGVVFVCVEISEQIGNIHKPPAAKNAAHIVQT